MFQVLLAVAAATTAVRPHVLQIVADDCKLALSRYPFDVGVVGGGGLLGIGIGGRSSCMGMNDHTSPLHCSFSTPPPPTAF